MIDFCFGLKHHLRGFAPRGSMLFVPAPNPNSSKLLHSLSHPQSFPHRAVRAHEPKFCLDTRFLRFNLSQNNRKNRLNLYNADLFNTFLQVAHWRKAFT